MNSTPFWELFELSPVIKNTNYVPGISELILGEYYIQEYYKILEFGVICFLLSFVLVFLAYLFSLNSMKDIEKLSEYECGFEPFDSATRLPFDVHFYIVGILFLIFDVEIAVLFPWVLGLKFIGWYGFYTMILFLIILTIGFIYEWQKGALNWTATNETKLVFVLRGGTFFLLEPHNPLSISEHINNILPNCTINIPSEFNSLWGETFLASFICLILIFVAYTAKTLDKNAQNVFSVSINNLSIFALLITFILLIQNWFYSNTTFSLFSMTLLFDLYSIIFKLIIICTVIIILISASFYLISRRNPTPEFSIIILLTTFFLLILVSAFNFFTAFLCIIGFSLNLYVLVLIDAEERIAREASIKYYFLSVYCSGFLIFGIFLFYLLTNSLNYVNIKTFLHNFTTCLNLGLLSNDYSYSILTLFTIALLSSLIGVLFKLSAFPCHFWAPEVYDGSPNSITAYFILPVKTAIFAFFIRLFSYMCGEISFLWQIPLLIVASCSLFWGCICAINELKIKRFIAYTSINQIGFLLIGSVTNTFAGYQTSILYLFIYILMNIAFLILFLNTYNFTTFAELKYIGDFKYIKFQQPTQMFFLTVIIFSMAGIPPFAGFFGKYFLLVEALNAMLYSLVIIALITSLISAYYYIRIVKVAFFDITIRDNHPTDYSKELPFINISVCSSPKIQQDCIPFIASLMFIPTFIIPWFRTNQKINQYLYNLLIFLIIGFVFIINEIYNISFLITFKTIFILS